MPAAHAPVNPSSARLSAQPAAMDATGWRLWCIALALVGAGFVGIAVANTTDWPKFWDNVH